MRNQAHMLAAIRGLRRQPSTIVEAGSGDGTFLLSLARKLEWKQPVRVILLDMQPVISEATLGSFSELGWNATVRKAKIQDWLANPETSADLTLGNLFWHHFNDDELKECFVRLNELTRAFIACEPRRWWAANIATRFLWAIGCSRVTQHDADISVRAGFRDSELSALWPRDTEMKLIEIPAGYASHLFIAERVGK
jgi:hypothetical protein